MSDFREALVLAVADVLMKSHGNTKYNTNAIEWDANEPDSQYSMALQDAKLSVETVLNIITDETLNEMYDDEEELEDEEVPASAPKHAQRRADAVTSSAALFIFMQTEPGKPTYVGDVREWLAAVDNASIPDDAEVEGHLHLSYDIDGPLIEKIECLECGYHDTLLTEHRH
jgi:hypothetical protein